MECIQPCWLKVIGIGNVGWNLDKYVGKFLPLTQTVKEIFAQRISFRMLEIGFGVMSCQLTITRI